MKEITVIMTPTVHRAVYEWKDFLIKWMPLIKKINRPNLYVELTSGHKIYFKGETEGLNALRGLHADIISIDEFLMSEEERMTYGYCVYHEIECDYKGDCTDCPHNTEEDTKWFIQDNEKAESEGEKKE